MARPLYPFAKPEGKCADCGKPFDCIPVELHRFLVVVRLCKACAKTACDTGMREYLSAVNRRTA